MSYHRQIIILENIESRKLDGGAVTFLKKVTALRSKHNILTSAIQNTTKHDYSDGTDSQMFERTLLQV